MVRRGQEMAIPLDVVARGVLELPAGVRIAIECSVRLWRAKRMTATDLDSLLSSVAWQSPTLSRHFEACTQRRNADGPECCAVLSNEDMAMLMNGGSEEHGPAKRRRATSSLTKQDCTPSGLALTPVHPLPEEPNVEHSFEILSGEDMLALMGRGSPEGDMSARIAGLAITLPSSHSQSSRSASLASYAIPQILPLVCCAAHS